MEDKALNELMAEFDKQLDSGGNPAITGKVKGINRKNGMRYYFIRTCFELIIGLITLNFLVSFLLDNLSSPSIVISASLIAVFSVAIIFASVRQLLLILKFDFNRDVVTNQSILTELQTRFLFWLRISILQIPFFLVYIILGFALFFNVDIWVHGDKTWLYSNIILGAVLLIPVIWLFTKLTPENVEVPWVRKVVMLAGGDHLIQSMEYLEQLKSFKNS